MRRLITTQLRPASCSPSLTVRYQHTGEAPAASSEGATTQLHEQPDGQHQIQIQKYRRPPIDEERKQRLLDRIGRDGTKISNQRKWVLTPDGKKLERQFRFKTFPKAMDFIYHVLAECKIRDHHPALHNVYRKVVLRWTTHRFGGLSSKDLHMAEFCDKQALRFDEKDEIWEMKKDEE